MTRRLGTLFVVTAVVACGQPTPGSGDGGTPDSGFALTLASVTPSHGPLSGGTAVTLTGTGFAPGLTLTFGDAGATSLNLLSELTLTAVTPAGRAAGPVDVTVTSAAGSATLPAAFTYDSPVGTIAYCALHSPATLATAPNVAAGPVYGWIYVPGVTDQGAAAGAGLRGEVGFGAIGSTPDATWHWAPASWDAKVGTSNHDDEYAGLLPPTSTPGTYDFAARFSRDDGGTWTPCDTGGDTPQLPYSPAKAGVLTVATPPPLTIAYCALHYPITLQTLVGQGAGPAYGWVYIPGVTDQTAGPGPGVSAELGFGPLGAIPSDSWLWVPASWDAKQGTSGHDDEYMASLPAQRDAGTFAYAYRFEVDGGTGWTYCDTAGDPAYDAGAEGVLTVTALTDAGPLVDYCNFQSPRTLLGEAFSRSTSVLGEVYELGVTDDAGVGPGISGQAGFGPSGSDPSLDGGGWQWFPASFFAKATNNDAYAATLTFPGPGTYAMAYRFSLADAGDRYCDANGDAIYTPANQAMLTVAAAPLTVDWCDLQFPAALTATPGEDAGLVYGQVYKKGVTDSAGQGGDVWAALGVGPLAGNPALGDSGFLWTPATSDGDRSGLSNDEYSVPLVAPDAGTYAYYFRFSLDDGSTWTVCGSQAPLAQGGDAGLLTVAAPDAGPSALVSYCAFQYPTTLLGETGTAPTGLYGVVYQVGITDDAGQGPGIGGEVGLGPLGSDPSGDGGGWTWTSASYFAKAGNPRNNDEYVSQITLPAAGSYALAYRFALNGGPYRYCDPAGDAAYDAGTQAVATVVAAPLLVTWCDVQFPATLTAPAGQDAGAIYGQVYRAGVTDGMGQGADVLAELGVGPHGADPTQATSGFTWMLATYDGDRNGGSSSCTPSCANDEYTAPLVAPASAGTYDYYFRFTEDDGRAWTVCGYQNPLDGGGVAGVLTAQ